MTQNHTRQQGSERFHSLLAEIAELHDRKQLDYGRQGDPFANVRASEDFGIAPWIGALIRENDKMRRLQKAASGGTLVNESTRDSLIDNAVYAIIALALWDEAHDITREEHRPQSDPVIEAAIKQLNPWSEVKPYFGPSLEESVQESIEKGQDVYLGPHRDSR